MKRKNKKIILLVGILAALFLLSGCTVPMVKDPETGKEIVKLITTSTTFSEIFGSESWFSALFVYPLSQAINYMTPVIGVAAAISVVTVGINVITMALTIKSTVASQRMQQLQPEMDKITKKYEGKTDDRSKMAQAQEMQNLYKKFNINPFSMLLTTFLQFPIIIAIYQSVQRAQAVAHGSFLGLSLEKTPWSGIMNGEWTYLLLFAFMLICQFGSMYLPQFLAKQKAKKDADKAGKRYVPVSNKANNMMYYMMVPIMVLSIMWPAAMTIYWAISSLTMVAKTLIVQKFFIDKKEG
ncbi:membrane protein insertase YidC [Anaerorhabdus sp.]|jgi:YidC/Oxa1 family membrane protein insertase|uniref:membrane protein insertase YidC n=1 Tax=Anaerorhabdus sp. TaxID=1872524 RepID=UPI002FCB3F18